MQILIILMIIILMAIFIGLIFILYLRRRIKEQDKVIIEKERYLEKSKKEYESLLAIHAKLKKTDTSGDQSQK
ncbi:hypothetical protein [Sphingobacterium faecium]|uniref:hypothetical protein n=2 Tax=Sphingobacteriaceae TaxID=84566 RepID=UPI00247A4A3E|nr:hypothetical protein [Sphingobacterium faecium]WGQ14508.1 hypothetical protein QG727_21095 [Sphingobacterium faecium]